MAGLTFIDPSPGSRPDIDLFGRLGADMPFSFSFAVDTWEEWTAVHDALKAVGAALTMSHISGSCSRYNGYEGPNGNWFVAANFYDGWWNFRVAARTEKDGVRLRDMITTLAGEAPILEPDAISMSIWTEHPMGGGLERYGRMKVGPWTEVMGNYPASVRERLESLAANLPDRSEGGIVIFGGKAGTGKTRAIEALCHAWARDAKLGVIVDSDRMLGSASYMTDVITSAGTDRRQVIVAEDADDMVFNGPKSAETSKLLNIADGLVGRLAGAGTLFVITANLPMDQIAPYITRPGRAAAAIEFEPFGPDEAAGWFSDRGVEFDPDGEMTLAEMFAVLRGAAVEV